MTTNIEWNDGMRPRGRKQWLLVITTAGEVLPFKGTDIPGTVVIRGTSFEKNGKWSNTTYRLVLATGVSPIAGVDGWETGTFREGLAKATGVSPIDTWEECARALRVTLESAKRFLTAWRPKAAAHFDEVEAKLASL